MAYEYGVCCRVDDELHRGPMPEWEATAWVDECEANGLKSGTFFVVRREVGEWSPF